MKTVLRRADDRKGLTGEWIEALQQEIAAVKEETGGPFVVRFPFPLGEAQERLVVALGVLPVYERGSDEELARLVREVA